MTILGLAETLQHNFNADLLTDCPVSRVPNRGEAKVKGMRVGCGQTRQAAAHELQTR